MSNLAGVNQQQRSNPSALDLPTARFLMRTEKLIEFGMKLSAILHTCQTFFLNTTAFLKYLDIFMRHRQFRNKFYAEKVFDGLVASKAPEFSLAEYRQQVSY